MKKIYPFLLSFVFILFTNVANAQCDFSDKCEDAISINLTEPYHPFQICDLNPLPPSGLKGSLSSCNTDAEASNFTNSDCFQENWKIIWFKINTGDHKFTDIRITSSAMEGLESFGIDLVAECGSGSILNFPLSPCSRVDKNKAFGSISMLELEQNTDYFIAVGSSLLNVGSFTIEVATYNIPSTENDNCFSQDIRIIPSASPPYAAGQIIDFTVKIPTMDLATQVFWLQSIIPIFGTGWDVENFNINSGEPTTSILPSDNWSWYNQEEIFYKKNSKIYQTYFDEFGKLNLCRGNDCPENVGNCLTENGWLPSGWFAYREGAGPTCTENSGNPNDGWGDGFGPWELTFSLKVRDLTLQQYLMEENLDLSIEIHTITDAEIGCWDPQIAVFNGCVNNKPAKFFGFIDCPNTPIIDAGDDLEIDCTEPDVVTITGSGPMESDYEILWRTIKGEILGDSTTYETEVRAPGRYQLVVRDTNYGCFSADEINISFHIPIIDIVSVTIDCHGDSTGVAEIVLEPGGSESILWSTGETGTSINQLSAGTYTVTIIDENCVSTRQVEILEPDEIVLGFDVNYPSESGIEDGNATVSISGGVMPYNILWSTGDTGDTIEDLAMGTYTVTLTDGNGCEKSGQIVLLNEECGFGARLVQDITNRCHGDNEASITIETSGEREKLNYLWSNGARGYTIRKLYAGDYSVTISNTDNCSITLEHTVEEPGSVDVEFSIIPESTTGGQDGYISSSVSGGVPPYNYLWSNGETTANISNISAGFYYLEITDSNNCTRFQEVELPNPPSMISIFPNPTSGIINVRGVQWDEISNYVVYDRWGNVVSNNDEVNADLIIDVSHLQPAVYALLIKLKNGGQHPFSLIKNN